MGITGGDLAVRRDRPVEAPVVETQQRARGIRASRHAHVDLVALHPGPAAHKQLAIHRGEAFFARELGLHLEMAKAGHAPGSAFDTKAIVQAPAEHLVAATDTEQLAAVAKVARDLRLPALLTQP